MRKYVFALIILAPHSAFAQVSGGTALVFNFSKDEVVVAADSRATSQNSNVPDDSVCKIRAINHQLIFAVTGHAFSRGSWDSFDLALDTVRTTQKLEMGDAYIDSITQKWADRILEQWLNLYQRNRSAVSQLNEANNGSLTTGIFIGVGNGSFYQRAAKIWFDRTDFINPIKWHSGELTDCWPCGQKEGAQLCAGGSHRDFADAFCSKEKLSSKVVTRTRLRAANDKTRLATKIVELTRDAYSSDVGGEVDVLTLKKNGTMIWNHRKDNCPENQVGEAK